MDIFDDLFFPGMTGDDNTFSIGYEARNIVLAQGLDFREKDFKRRQAHPGNDEEPLMDFLQRNFDGRISIDGDNAEYVSEEQMVIYKLKLVYTREEYKTALMTEDLHVIYQGHSRYGRGACFDAEPDWPVYMTGNRWEDGTNNNNGTFRLGYPYVPVEIEDFEHHQYDFAPVPAEWPVPKYSELHPDARNHGLTPILLPEEYQPYVQTLFTSPTNRYYGYYTKMANFILHSGWDGTSCSPYDMGATEINCRAFVHFGCTSKTHFWEIIRDKKYKKWQRDNPPTNRFAYFTTNLTNDKASKYWLFNLFSYNKQNNFESWWNSLEYAKKNSNVLLIRDHLPFQIY